MQSTLDWAYHWLPQPSRPHHERQPQPLLVSALGHAGSKEENFRLAALGGMHACCPYPRAGVVSMRGVRAEYEPSIILVKATDPRLIVVTTRQAPIA